MSITITPPNDYIPIGVPYSGFFTATGGVAPYTWFVNSGGFPTGLTFNTATGELSGTPTVVGPVSVQVEVDDSGANSKTLNLDIAVFIGGFITGTPRIVDDAHVIDTITESGYFVGPLCRNGKSYAVAVYSYNPGAGPLNVPVIYESSDNWLTRTEIGGFFGAGLPAGVATCNGPQFAWDERSPFPQVITFAFTQNTDLGPIVLQDFNIDTRIWSALYGTSGGPSRGGTGQDNRNFHLARRSDHSIILFARKNHNVCYSVCAPGANWVSSEVVAATRDLQIGGCVVDYRNNTTHFTYFVSDYYYRNVDFTGGLGPETQFVFAGRFVNQAGDGQVRIYIGADNQLYVVFNTGDAGAPFHQRIYMRVGSGNLAAPTWTEEEIVDVSALLDTPDSFTEIIRTFANNTSSGQAILFSTIESTSNNDYFRLYSATRTGVNSWTTPIVFYDEASNLPPIIPGSSFIEGVSFMESNGRTQVLAYLHGGSSVSFRVVPFYFPNPGGGCDAGGGGIPRGKKMGRYWKAFRGRAV